MHVRLFVTALLALALASCAMKAEEPESQRFPTSKDYPATMMGRISVTAGDGLGWKLSALETPKRENAAWKVVIITGTPSWSEYWAPTLAAAPQEWEMVVADRPGFSLSEPQHAVTKIADQARALSALLEGPADQKVVLVGQSYGAPIAAWMASQHPDKVKAVVLMSAFFGQKGPTARRLTGLGAVAGPLLPRDLKNALAEVRGQDKQLPTIRAAMKGMTQPIVVLHGDKDTFVTPEAAQELAQSLGARLVMVPGGDHFLNACCVKDVVGAVELAVREVEG